MAANRKIHDDLAELRADASKVLTDISKLTKNIPEVTRDQAETASKEALEGMEQEITQLSGRLADLNRVIKEQVGQADKHVHENPYPYIAGAIVVGALLGKSLLGRVKD